MVEKRYRRDSAAIIVENSEPATNYTVGEQIGFLQLVGGAVAMMVLYLVKRAAVSDHFAMNKNQLSEKAIKNL